MTIKSNLNMVIRSINDFSARTNIVAINTAIRASKLSKSEGAPFEVLAREIQNMSNQSIDKLSELDSLVNEIAELSLLINKTGGQRMLLMKMVNAKWMENENLLYETKTTFAKHLLEIKQSKINNKTTELILQKAENDWLAFEEQLSTTAPSLLFDMASVLIDQINRLMSEYERYVG